MPYIQMAKLTQQQLEAHLWGAANILRGKTAGQDYKNYILSLMFYKRLCDQWENEADEAIAEQERQQGRTFTEKEKAIFRTRGEHRFNIPGGSRWGDVLAVSENIGEKLTDAMRSVANANDELRGVFTVDWNQPAPDASGKKLIPNEVVHALIQHFEEIDLSNKSVPSDILGRAYEYLIKQFADDAGAKAGEFFTPPEVVDILVRILQPKPGDTVYDPTCGSGGMLIHSADYLREQGENALAARYFGQEMNWGNYAIGKINSVLHGLEADIKGGASTITDPQFLDQGGVRKFSLVMANFPFSDEFWWLKPEQQTDDKKKREKLKKEVFGSEGYKDPYGRFGRGTGFHSPPAGYGDYAFILHILASLTDAKRCELKKLLKTTAPETALRFKLQRDSMKWLLVCCFGYTGYKNARFGKIEAHEAINAVTRETLLVAKEIAEADGFELIHALVDSLYVWKDGATREDYERLSQKIEDRTRLPLAIESVYRYVVFLPSKQYADVPVPNRFFAVGEDGELKVRGLECRRHDTPPLLGRMQHEVLAILAEAHDHNSYLQKLEVARGVFANYEERLATGEVDIRELVVSKRITREPRDYQKAGVTAIAAQQLFGSGVKLRPGQNIEYIITNAEAQVPNDRVRAYALWEGWFGYDRKKYTAMLREAFEPFALCVPKRAEPVLLSDSISESDLKRFPLFSTLAISRL